MTVLTGLAALTSMKPLVDLGLEIRDATNVEKLRALADEALQHAINARAQTALLQDERNAAVLNLAALEAEIEKAKAFDAEAKNYGREITRNGATVYREKDAGGIKASSPYFCPNCFSNKRISVMNPSAQANISSHTIAHDCSACSHSTQLPRLRNNGFRPHPTMALGVDDPVI